MSEMVKPFVSVVIPCLNRAHFLVPTIESVLQQDYPYTECIVVDGGSTDGTVDILKSYGDTIKWVSEPDDGHADAINKGWKMSRGEILAWLNADDVWAVPDAVSQSVAYMESHPDVDVVYGDCGAIDTDGNLVGMSYLHEWDLEYAVVYCDHCIPQPAAFMRRSALERVGWLDTDVYTKDRELWLRIGLEGKIKHIPVLLAHARRLAGLSQDGIAVAPACVQVTRKFYSLPNIPSPLERRKRQAFSNSYLRGMQYAFEGGRHWNIIFNYALRAALMSPRNAANAFGHLRRYVRVGGRENKRLRWARLALELPSLPRRALRKLKNRIQGSASPRITNLLGDRDIEWSWVAAQILSQSGRALDFGNGGSAQGLLAALRGYDVTAVDMGEVKWPYTHPRLRFVRGDILRLPLPKEDFDLVINCSTVEHVGLVGRYGVTEDRPDGDLEAMAHLRDLMKPGATMLLTIPVGQDGVFAPLTRVYGPKRLPRLLEGYTVVEEAFWVKDEQNRWVLCDRETALNFEASGGSWDPLQNAYGLACFVLRRPVQ